MRINSRPERREGISDLDQGEAAGPGERHLKAAAFDFLQLSDEIKVSNKSSLKR